MAYVHRDGVHGVLRPRRGARLAALTSGGAIAEVGDYRVIAEPDDTPVGTVNEDFAIESMVGDVFLLGTHSWRIRRVTQGEVRVTDAEGAHPTIPFWVGEAPSRTEELSEEVSALRHAVGELLADAGAGDGVPPRHRRGPGACRGGVRARRRRGRATGPVPGGRPGRARHAADRRRHRVRAVLRRGGRHADGGARAAGRPHQPGTGPGAAQAVLRHLRLRAPGRRQRRLGRAVARPPAQLPARQRPAAAAVGDGRGGPAPGGAGVAHVRGPMALEPQPLPGRAALPGREEEPPPHPAHGGRRPHGRGLPGPRRVPGEHARAARW